MWYCASCGSNVDETEPRCGSCGGRRPAAEEGVYEGPEYATTTKVTSLPLCPRCEGTMSAGFLGHGPSVQKRSRAVLPVDWFEGLARWSFWWGAVSKGPGMPLRAYRCDRCGFLEFYAPDSLG
jgi:hypothetical protein